MHILTFNSGSSSLKFGFYRVDDGRAEMLLDGVAEGSGATATLRAGDRGREWTGRDLSDAERAHPLDGIATLLDRAGLPAPDAVGHRIVHGGFEVRDDCRIDDEVLQRLERARRFAPLHLPPALAAIRFAMARYPDVSQVACLDTAFHARMDEVARRLPLPRSYDEEGVHRYGFHGLSCASIVRRLGDEVPERLVIAHLGNGSSVTALRKGRSIDTTMGLTPAGGVPMGTRSGDLDPGVVIHLIREHGMDADALEDLFDRHCGLAGVSGIGSDMRALRVAAATNDDARLAIDLFCYAVRKQVAAMAAALGGLDALVFSGGIGEHDARTRSDVCAGLVWMGVVLDGSRNALAPGIVSAEASKVVVRVVPSAEDEQIALEVVTVLVTG